MKTDKNTIIGFVLLFALFALYFWYNNDQKMRYEAVKQKQHIEDSIRDAAKQPKVDSAKLKADTEKLDSANKIAMGGDFPALGTEATTVVENDLIKATFSNKGGVLKSVELKKFKSWDSAHVILGGGKNDKLGYSVKTGERTAQTSDLYFTPSAVTSNADGSQTISYSVGAQDGRGIKHSFTIRKNEYLIDWNVEITQSDRLLDQHTMNMEWVADMRQHQKDIKYERTQTSFGYMEDGSYDFTRSESGVDNKLDNVEWMSYKQQFFNTTIVPKTKFETAQSLWAKQEDTSHVLYVASSSMKLKLPATPNSTASFQLYFGPNDYKILSSYDNGMKNIVDLGSGMFAFVKYINRGIIMPVFNGIAGFIGNYGWVIALLTLFIRLVTSPLTYKSYLSGAKMKVLRPELDELKKKHGGDQQAFAMDQMKLFREAGVSPLGGCLPALLQIPIFFSLYSFFNSNLAVRGQSFLWADDLSQYDVIATLPFSIPAFGDHISLFTLTAVATSFLISIYNISMTPTQDNPVLKYMPYIFPVVLLFIFNKLPSALTWYYTVSNIITLGLQFVIQKYIIDHDKILAQIDQKRKQPRKKSKWTERYEQMMEQQKKVQDVKQQNKSKR